MIKNKMLSEAIFTGKPAVYELMNVQSVTDE